MKAKKAYPVGTITKLLQTLGIIEKYAKKAHKQALTEPEKQQFYMIGKVAEDAIAIATE